MTLLTLLTLPATKTLLLAQVGALKKENRDPGSRIEDQLQDRGSGIGQNRGSGIEDRGSRIEDRGESMGDHRNPVTMRAGQPLCLCILTLLTYLAYLLTRPLQSKQVLE